MDIHTQTKHHVFSPLSFRVIPALSSAFSPKTEAFSRVGSGTIRDSSMKGMEAVAVVGKATGLSPTTRTFTPSLPTPWALRIVSSTSETLRFSFEKEGSSSGESSKVSQNKSAFLLHVLGLVYLCAGFLYPVVLTYARHYLLYDGDYWFTRKGWTPLIQIHDVAQALENPFLNTTQ